MLEPCRNFITKSKMKGVTDGAYRMLGGSNRTDHLYGGHAYILAVYSYRQDVWSRQGLIPKIALV